MVTEGREVMAKEADISKECENVQEKLSAAVYATDGYEAVLSEVRKLLREETDEIERLKAQHAAELEKKYEEACAAMSVNQEEAEAEIAKLQAALKAAGFDLNGDGVVTADEFSSKRENERTLSAQLEVTQTKTELSLEDDVVMEVQKVQLQQALKTAETLVGTVAVYAKECETLRLREKLA